MLFISIHSMTKLLDTLISGYGSDIFLSFLTKCCLIYVTTNLTNLPCLFKFSWDIDGAVFGTQCGEIESGSALVFEKEGRRRVCTPYLDTTSYGNLRFHFIMGATVIRVCYLILCLLFFLSHGTGKVKFVYV